MMNPRIPRCSVWLLAILALPPWRAAAQTAPTKEATGGVLDLIFIGDSITAGAGLDSPTTEAPPVVCARLLHEKFPKGSIYFSNQGHSGHTTQNFLPGGQDFNGVEAVAKQLTEAHPGQLVFSVMLGTNDSANSGPLGAPVSAEKYQKNLAAMLEALKTAHPGCVVFLHHPIWYSPNTHNRADYEGEATPRLKSYFPVLDALAVGEVHRGDAKGYDYFAGTAQTEYRAEKGQSGVFYLHPNAQGAASLGKFWAEAIGAVVGKTDGE